MKNQEDFENGVFIGLQLGLYIAALFILIIKYL